MTRIGEQTGLGTELFLVMADGVVPHRPEKDRVGKKYSNTNGSASSPNRARFTGRPMYMVLEADMPVQNSPRRASLTRNRRASRYARAKVSSMDTNGISEP